MPFSGIFYNEILLNQNHKRVKGKLYLPKAGKLRYFSQISCILFGNVLYF